jgi:alkylated DNA repair dioxygenase AlkB
MFYSGVMARHLQGSLFDSSELGLLPLTGMRRTQLSDGAWIDELPGWVTGADEMFDALVDSVPWKTERWMMYEREVESPRLLAHYGEADPLPHPLLDEARETLSRHYAAGLDEPFVTAGLCYYRDGRDSVAWHGDRSNRGDDPDTLVAIASLGEARRLLLRPRYGGGPVVRRSIGHGDLLVMGGSCQRTWDHAVPKTAGSVGPRISVQFRPRWVA